MDEKSTRAPSATSAAMAFAAGYVDTVGFVAIAGLFTAHVTGNFVVIGAALVNSNAGLVGKLLALPTFAVAVAFASLVAGLMRRRNHAPGRSLLALQIAMLLLFMTIGIAASPIHDPDALLSVLAGLSGVFAMATQNAAARLAFSDLAPTTVMTENVTQVVLDAVDLLTGTPDPGPRKRFSRMWPPVLSFAVGAISGALLFVGVGFAALLAPIFALVKVFVLQRTSAP